MDAEKLVQALSAAWSGVQLYPDPVAVPAFVKAVDTIGEFADSSLVLTVTVDGFEAGSELLPVSHSATHRLVQALFAKSVESLVVAAPSSPEELIRCFAIVEEESDDEFGLDLPTRMELAGITSIRFRCHDLLEDREEDEEEEKTQAELDRHPEVEALFEADSVQRIADRAMAAASPELAAIEFVSMYRASYERLGDGDPAGLERVVQTFVDALFKLEHHFRARVFEAVIEAREELPFQHFLDQFSVDELAELGGQIRDSVLPLLLEYARVVSEMQGRDPGMVEQIMGEGNGADARGAVADSVGVHLANFLSSDTTDSEQVAALAEEVAGLVDGHNRGWLVLGDLFAIEHRGDRLRRLLRIWAAKVSDAIRTRAFADAVEWVNILPRAELDPRLLDDAYRQAATDEILEILTAEGAEDRATREELLGQLSRRAGKRVLEQLATEEDPGRRRLLIDIVTEIARVDIRSILPGLNDPRWYVVRNVAIALGKSGRRAAGEPLGRLVRHEDHRVRIEALRALFPCLGNASVDHLVSALADDHVRVRASATDLLNALDDEVVIPALSSAVGNETLSVEARVAVIEALGNRTDEAARGMLKQMAETRSRFSSSARALRAAAREALRSGRD